MLKHRTFSVLSIVLALFLAGPSPSASDAGAAQSVSTAKPAPAAPTPSSPSPPAKPVPSSPAPVKTAAQQKRVNDGQKDFCNLVRSCGLPEPAGYCPAPSALEKPGFKYDSARCLEGRLLNSRGVTPAHPIVGYKLYRFLGMEYRVIYTVEDDIPISEARLAYLLADLPLAAKLISHFRKEPYTAEYIDAERKAFKGTKGKRLRGEARLISGTTEERRLFYFGYGVAEVAFWKLKGPALMDFSYAASPFKDKVLRYKMKLLVFPGSGVINSIMNLGMFRKVVLGKIKEVLVDITDSAKKLAAGGGAELLKSNAWTPEEKRKVEAFLKLP